MLLIPQLLLLLPLLVESAGADDSLCSNIPTGMNKLSLGVDITALDLLPADFLAPADGFKGPVVDFTCRQGKVWRDPYTGTTYQVPDQVWTVFSEPGGWMDTSVSTYKSSDDVKKSLALSAGVKLRGGFFSASASYKQLSDVIENRTSYVNDVRSFVSATKAQFMPASILGLTAFATAYLEALPTNFTDDPDQFMEFIRVFGTHYFARGRFGGVLRMVSETQTSYYSSHTEEEVTAQVELSFFKYFKSATLESAVSTDRFDSEFVSLTRNISSFYGGNTSISGRGGTLKAWQRTVPSKPWIFGGELRPITDLIPPSLADRVGALEQAVQAHLDKAWMQELHAEVTSGVQRLEPGGQREQLTQDLLPDLEAQMGEQQPDHGRVTRLAADIRAALGRYFDTGDVAVNKLPVISLSHVETSSHDLCSNIPTGLTKLALGVDVTTIDFQPLDFTGPDGYMSPVLDFTCSQGKVWRDPYSGQTFQQPDQVWRMVSESGGLLHITESTYRTLEELKRSMTASAGVEDIPFEGALFSGSGSFRHFSHVIQTKSSFVNDISSFVSSTKAHLNPSLMLPLSPIATRFLHTLPADFAADPAGYMSFINTFGTHYLSKARFGGFLRVVLETNSSYYSSLSETDAKSRIQALYMKVLEANGDFEGSVSSDDAEFASATRKRIRYYGGDSSLLGAGGGREEWESSVSGNPWLFGGTLRPITDLIPESLASKRAAMQRATECHFYRAFLKNDLKDQILSALNRYPHDYTQYLSVGHRTEDSLLAQVDALADGYPEQDSVDALVDRFKAMTASPPPWWPETRLCVDGDCAVVDSYIYPDPASQRSNVSISAPGGGDLFGASICFWDTGAPWRNSSITWCEHTDERNYTSLELRVPRSAPIWLLNARLCYHWCDFSWLQTSLFTRCVSANERLQLPYSGRLTRTEFGLMYNSTEVDAPAKCPNDIREADERRRLAP